MEIIKRPEVLKTLVEFKHVPTLDDSETQDWQVAVLRSLVFIGLATILRRRLQNLPFCHRLGCIYRDLDLTHQLEKYSREIPQCLNYSFLTVLTYGCFHLKWRPDKKLAFVSRKSGKESPPSSKGIGMTHVIWGYNLSGFWGYIQLSPWPDLSLGNKNSENGLQLLLNLEIFSTVDHMSLRLPSPSWFVSGPGITLSPYKL